MRHVLAWGLPIDSDLMAAIKRTFVPAFLSRYPQCSVTEYLQGR